MAEEPGQWTDIKPADSNVKAICKEVRPDVEKRVGKSFEEFMPLQYTSQKQNGINYWIKVHVGGEDSLHLKAHQDIKTFGEGTKITIVRAKNLADELVPK
ncbi:cystatin-B-like isoform X3 [Erpetoichthys calabaricus]|uniref:cystatin-B-like isoform X3 n=1 Tax=Erpetoichthys calabaricus TaxID=27687 RepID=UPI0010A0218B|nr:cystatin-B-like isoform X3 [Erpetoichthys calabaricus]